MRFELSLARELHMTRSQLRREMSSEEFGSWVAYFRIEASEQKKAQRVSRGTALAQQRAAKMRETQTV